MTTESESYAKHPKSLTEARSDKSGQATDWTPRDALIAMLRSIDSGEVSPKQLVILYDAPNAQGIMQESYSKATSDPRQAIWLCNAIGSRLMQLYVSN